MVTVDDPPTCDKKANKQIFHPEDFKTMAAWERRHCGSSADDLRDAAV